MLERARGEVSFLTEKLEESVVWREPQPEVEPIGWLENIVKGPLRPSGTPDFPILYCWRDCL